MHYIPYEGEAFNGIISYFYSIGDPLNCQNIIVSPSSENGIPTFGYAQSVLNGSHERGWYSNDVAFSYINLSYPFNRLLLTHYSLQSPYHMNNQQFAVSWRLMAKNYFDSSWNLLDQRTNMTVLVGNGKYSTFSCVSSQAYSLFQIQMIDPNNYGWHFFGLKQVEFFGAIYDSNTTENSNDCYFTQNLCNNMVYSIFHLLYYTLFVFI